MAKEQPLQPLYWDTTPSERFGPAHLRFQSNQIVRDLVDESIARGEGLNRIVTDYQKGKYEQADLEQLYQLIGYSYDGASTLSCMREEILERAMAAFVAAGNDPDNPPQKGA